MEKDATYTVNRQELIKMARESCEENLKASGNGKFTYGLSKKKGGKSQSRKMSSSLQAVEQLDSVRRQQSMRSLFIRTSIACVMMLAVIAVDKFNLSYKDITKETVQKTVESNSVYEQVQNFFNTDTGKEILAVFNRRD